MRRGTFILFFDLILVAISFYFLIFLKYNQAFNVPLSGNTVLHLLPIWIIISLLTGKYTLKRINDFKETLLIISFSNLVILGLSVILIKIWKPFVEFRFILIYSIFLATALELLFGYFFVTFRKAMDSPFFPDKNIHENGKTAIKEADERIIITEEEKEIETEAFVDLHSIIIEETDQETFSFIIPYFSTKRHDILIISTTTVFNLYNQPRSKYKVIINLKRINDIQYINKFFEAVNAKLDHEGLFIDWVETYSQRKSRILSKYPWGLNYFIYTLDFIVKRVFPKINLTKKLYFLITRGQNRVISKAETFGRLYSCGFEIVEEKFINNMLYFVFKKIKEPTFDYHPTYGPIIKLQRIGKNGKIIGVFKLRTMHAYSEYLQAYVYSKHNLEEGGKFKNDFRITTLGRFCRTMWIDELPMLINVFFLRDMKIVGVRPLSLQYFSLYGEELKQKRILSKPGLIPPFYAQYPTPKTLEEIQENEMKYLEEYEKHKIRTDLKYFFKAMYNIIFKRARSK
jgi:lipopolysaccharide/colanic/teichoic acid biosynthesis glycosyltransferase